MDMIYSTLIENVTNKMEQEKKEDKYEIPVDFISHFYVGAIFQIGMNWLQSKNYYKEKEILKYIDLLIPDHLI